MSKVIGRECRFVTHLKSVENVREDIHVVKEVLHYEDGSKKDNLKVIKDFKRPYWITKEAYRNHKDKKEWTEEYKLNKYESTQSDLVKNAGKMLGKYGNKLKGLPDLCDSPYIYGVDISSSAIIKNMYKEKYPDFNTSSTVAVYDIETNMLEGPDGIIMASIAFKNMVYTVALNSFLSNIDDPHKKIDEAFNKYIPDEDIKKDLKYKVDLVDTEIEIVRKIFKQAHLWGPDFLAAWSISFDIPKTIKACEAAGVDPKDIFCDPDLPDNYKNFWWREGRKYKVSDSGKHTPINIEEQWHTAECTSKFFMIDAMSSYKYIRLNGPSLSGGYSLDNVLSKEVNITKLKFKEAEGKLGADWHVFMQRHYPVEYIIYNQWDCLSMLVLDKKTGDLKDTLPTFSGISEYKHFSSDPRKIVDILHYYLLERDFVIGSTPRNLDKLHEKSLSLKDWIITLPSYNMADNGLKILGRYKGISTNIRCHNFDNDCESSYPRDTLTLNVSKSTTRREICSIEGVDERVFRLANINLLSGKANAISYCTTMFNLPNIDKLTKMYLEEKR